MRAVAQQIYGKAGSAALIVIGALSAIAAITAITAPTATAEIAETTAPTGTVVFAPQRPVAAPEAFAKQLSTFRAMRSEILNLIGTARNRIWLATDYLTDGEIVAALYIAQYRKLDVRVLLGPERANSYMSRLSFLKKQSIPVYLKTSSLRFASPTGLLVDQRLYVADSDLNFMTPQRQFQLRVVRRGESNGFEQGFQLALRDAMPAVVRPMQPEPRQAVRWRPSSQKTAAREREGTRNGTRSQPQAAPRDPYLGEADGSYNYNTAGYSSRNAPSGMPTQLPKQPLYARPKAKPPEGLEKKSPDEHNKEDTVSDSTREGEGAAEATGLDASPLLREDLPGGD